MAYDLVSKQGWLDLAEGLCQPLYTYWESDASLVRFPNRHAALFSDDIASFECFARPLWAMAGLVANGDHELGRRICTMIKNGVNPQLKSYWGPQADFSQVVVDAPEVAFFLFSNPSLLEEEFTEQEKRWLADWLTQVASVKVWNNNWHFFPLLVNAILLQLDMGGSRESIQTHWQAIDKHYVGNGWYGDGNNQQRDYYIAWGYHFYSLLWLHVDKSMPSDIRTTIVDRAEEFANSFKLFFDETGEAIPYGRSLVYRFAQVAFWSAYKLNGLNGQTDEVVKGIIARNISWWLNRSILRPDGTLNIGYAYDNQRVADPYSAEGSPYWAFTAFVLLLIPDDDLFWSACLGAYDQRESVVFTPGKGVCISQHKGIASLYPFDQKTGDPWPNAISNYQKFIYSTRFGFCFESGFTRPNQAGADCSIALSIDNGPWIARNNATNWLIHEDNVVSSVWRPDSRTSVTTYVCPFGSWHVRIHLIETNASLKAIDCGFSVPSPCNKETSTEDQWVRLTNSQLKLCSMAGSLDGSGNLDCYKPPVNSNLLHPRVTVPSVARNLKPGSHVWVNAFYGGVGEPQELPKATLQRNHISISFGNKCVAVHLSHSKPTANTASSKPSEQSLFSRIMRKVRDRVIK